jgi:hypothetical protein
MVIRTGPSKQTYKRWNGSNGKKDISLYASTTLTVCQLQGFGIYFDTMVEGYLTVYGPYSAPSLGIDTGR